MTIEKITDIIAARVNPCKTIPDSIKPFFRDIALAIVLDVKMVECANGELPISESLQCVAEKMEKYT